MKSALLTLLAASPLAAQTFIVDSNNGAGTNFTDLPPAIAAVPSGATLRVRVGTYSPFQISNKTLLVIGEKSGSAFPTVRMTSSGSTITVGPLNASQSVTISGLSPAPGTPTPPSMSLNVTTCAGSVLIEDLTFPFANGRSYLAITDSPNVHFARVSMAALAAFGVSSPASIVVQNSSVEFSRLSAFGYSSVAAGVSGTTALEITQQSRVVLVDSSVIGGPGNNITSTPPSVGGAAILATGGSTLHAFANSNATTVIAITGGAGGTGLPPTRGGDGLVLQQGSFARVLGITLKGGTGTPSGQPFAKDASSTLDANPNDITPSGFLAGVVQPANTVKYTLHGRAGSAAALVLGFAPQFLMVPILALGELGLNSVASVGPVTVPANGLVEIPSLVPGFWPTNTVLLAQFLVFDPTTNEVRASQLFTATSRF